MAFVLPKSVEYFPAGQSVHATLPVVDLYFPAAQAVHVPPSVPVYPVLQLHAEAAADEVEDTGHAMQFVKSFAAVMGLYVPAVQLLHATLPLVGLYFPAVQAVQVPPCGPVYPGLHKHDVEAVHVVHDEFEFAGHAKHGVEPVVDLYQPKPH